MVKNIAYITDSIGANIQVDLLEKVTKAKVKRAKAYAATKRSKSEGFKFPETNFTDVVPKVLASGNIDVAVTMAPSVEISNLPKHAHDECALQEASNSSYNMIKVAALALDKNRNLKQFIIAERAPRFDQWSDLNNFANEELHEALNKVEDIELKKRIVIGKHNLDCSKKGLQESRYGDPRVKYVDGIHMKGSSGCIAMTRSMAAILARAGLCNIEEAEQVGRSEPRDPSPETDFQVQRGRGGAPRLDSRPQETSTQNRYAALGN